MKFGQHIDWHLNFPSDAEGSLGRPVKTVLELDKPRKTLAELFESVSFEFESSSSAFVANQDSEYGGIRRSTSAKKSTSENCSIHTLPPLKKSINSGPLLQPAKADARSQATSNQSHRSSSTQVHHGSDEENMVEAEQIPTPVAHERNKPSSKSCDLGQILQKPDGTPEHRYGSSNNYKKKPGVRGQRQEEEEAKGGYFWQVKVLQRKGKFSREGKGRRGKVETKVEIPEKMLGLAWVGTEPVLLTPGSHSFAEEGFVLEEVLSEKTSFLKHGHLHRVRIREGHLGVAWIEGKAMLLEAGTSVHSCPSGAFSYVATDDKMLCEKEFVLGPFRIVTVADCEVGIKFCNREPQIMYSGRHCLSISRLEVFAGFESLLRRESRVRGVTATSNDNRKLSADIWMEWQIKAEDAAAARVASVTDVEGAVCDKVRRAFNLATWEVNANDIAAATTGSNITDPQHPVLKKLARDIQKECMDLFEEGWAVTLWELQVRELAISEEEQSSEDRP